MYQSRVRPDTGSRESVAQRSSSISRSRRGAIEIVRSILKSTFGAGVTRSLTLALVTAGVVASLAGCGGVTYRNTSTGSGGSGSSTATAELSGITCATQSLTGPQVSACTASLSASASSAVSVTLTSSNSALQVPTTVTIAAGSTTGDFNATSTAVSQTTSVTITGSANGISKTDVITLHPEAISTSASLSGISCGTQSLTGAQTKGCTVSLTSSASSAVSVTLSSSSSALQVPTSVTIAAGSASGSFNAVSSAVSATTSVTITGSSDGVSKTDVMTIYPATAPPITLSSISCGTQTLTGPTTEACTVKLSAAGTSSTVVTLSSSNSALQVPSSLTIASGASSGGFNATASAVTTTQSATLTATYNGVKQTDVLQLDGTSSAPHQVQLSWQPPPSTSLTIVGYNIYRSTTGSSFEVLNSAIDANTNYLDTDVTGGQTYTYEVKSVDSSGAESSPSNPTTVTVP